MHEILAGTRWIDYCSDPGSDLDTLPVNDALLGEHLPIGAGIAAVDLGNRMPR